MWVYADFLGFTIFTGKRVIGLPNVGYRPSSHNQDSYTQGQIYTVSWSFSILRKNQFKLIVTILVPSIASSSVKLSIYTKLLRWTTTLKIEQLKIAVLDNKKLKIPGINAALEREKGKNLNLYRRKCKFGSSGMVWATHRENKQKR